MRESVLVFERALLAGLVDVDSLRQYHSTVQGQARATPAPGAHRERDRPHQPHPPPASRALRKHRGEFLVRDLEGGGAQLINSAARAQRTRRR